MLDAKIISSDSHVVEPPDTWNGWLPMKYRDRAPRVVGDADGDWWFVDGVRTNSFQGGAQTGKCPRHVVFHRSGRDAHHVRRFCIRHVMLSNEKKNLPRSLRQL